MSVFAHLLRRARLSAGLSQQDLAERSGVSVRQISYLESGRTRKPYRRTVELLADALKLDEQTRADLENAARASMTMAAGEMEPALPIPAQLPYNGAGFNGTAVEMATLTRQRDQLAGGLTAIARPEVPAPPGRSARHRLYPPAWAGWVAVGAAMVVVGVVLGANLTGSANPTADTALPGVVPPPARLGPGCGQPVRTATAPRLCVSPDDGSPATAFTVRVSGFKPDRGVTLTLIFFPRPPQVGPPPVPRIMRTVTASANGKVTFKPLRLGLYAVLASESGTRGPSVVFRVLPVSAGP